MRNQGVIGVSRQPSSVSDVEVVSHGQVPADLIDYARDKMLGLVRYTGKPVLHLRIKLATSHDPAVSRPAEAQVDLDVNGRLLRAHAAAPTLREAIDLTQDRLRRRLSRTALHWEARRGRTSVRQAPSRRNGSASAPPAGPAPDEP